MKARLLLIAVGVLCLALFASCKDDPYKPPPVDQKEPDYPDLTQKDDVFKYLQLVWEYKDIEAYAKLLDEDFIFFFSPDDYQAGTTPQQWGRTEELASARNIFSGNTHPQFGMITKIDLLLTPEGNWIEVPKTEPPYEGETWYQRTAEYDIILDTTSEYTIQGLDRKTLFTIRHAEVDGETFYRIVQWHDDIQ